MLTLPAAGQRLHREVLELEQSLNIAMAKAAALTQTCALTRNLPNVGASSGQATMIHLSSLSQHLTKSASDVARVHQGLRDLNRDRVVMVPDGDGDCPPISVPSAIVAA